MNKLVVMAKAFEGRSEELARWYDDRHLADLLKVPGFVSAERHQMIPLKGPAGLPVWDFLLVYEIEGDPMTVLGTMGGLMGTEAMPVSEALESASTLSLVAMSKMRRQSEASQIG